MPFKPGFDPNRNMNGRPPIGQSWAEITRAMSSGAVPESLKAIAGEASTLREAITLKLFEMALEGDLGAIKLLQERSEGRCTVTEDKGRELTELERSIRDGRF